MSKFDEIIEYTNSKNIKDGIELEDLLHDWLVLGQTRHVCRYGTLSDGHEKITDSQRYAQAIKEIYHLAVNIKGQECVALEAQADLMDHEEELEESKKLSDRLKAKAQVMKAQLKLSQALITIKDQMRMLDEYNKVKSELESSVRSKYKNIEEAEVDNWKAVAKLKFIRSKTPGLAPEMMTNVPLAPEEKAELGFAYKRPDMIAPLIVQNEKKALELEKQFNNQEIGESKT